MKEVAGETKDLTGLHDVNAAARIVNKSHWWLRKLAKRGSLQFIRVGTQRRLMFSASALLGLLEVQNKKSK